MPSCPDDDLLLRWRKLPAPAVALPPPGLRLTGWRDPFVYPGASSAADSDSSNGTLPGQQSEGYRMLLGSGLEGSGGALLAYSSSGSPADGGSSLAGGWQYEGQVCGAADLAAAAAADGGGSSASLCAAHELGAVWECPLLVPLQPGGSKSSSSNGGSASTQLWLLAVSPYPVKPPHSPSNPVLYWIGHLDGSGTRQAAAAFLLRACRPAPAHPLNPPPPRKLAAVFSDDPAPPLFTAAGST